MKSKTDNGSARFVSVGAVIVCAGKGERMGLAYNKILHRIGRKTVLEAVLDTFSSPFIDKTVVVSSARDRSAIEEIAALYKNVTVCEGGSTRAQSVGNGLCALGMCDIAVIHDGARPFVTQDIIKESIDSAVKYGSGIAAVPATDTIKRVGGDGTAHSLPRAELYNIQTPQAFVYSQIKHAYDCLPDNAAVTDDSEVLELAGFAPRLVRGSYDNIKITTAADLFGLPKKLRIGVGFDVHRLVPQRALVLGGVKIEYDRGLLGHSDADVLVHAIMDALLSAAGLPDIGVLFPDTDDRYLGISSMSLLTEVVSKVTDNYGIQSVSAVVTAQQPKLSPHIPLIRKSLSDALGIEIDKVNVSATTTEKLGIIGSGDAIAADASCILTEIDR